MAIAKQRALERFKWATVLQRQARGHGSVTRVSLSAVPLTVKTEGVTFGAALKLYREE